MNENNNMNNDTNTNFDVNMNNNISNNQTPVQESIVTKKSNMKILFIIIPIIVVLIMVLIGFLSFRFVLSKIQSNNSGTDSNVIGTKNGKITKEDEKKLLVKTISFSGRKFSVFDITLNKLYPLNYHLDYDENNYYVDEAKDNLIWSSSRDISKYTLITKDNYMTLKHTIPINSYNGTDFYLVLDGNNATSTFYNKDMQVFGASYIDLKIQNYVTGKDEDYKDCLIASIKYGYGGDLYDLDAPCDRISIESFLDGDYKPMCVDNKDLHLKAMKRVLDNYPKIVVEGISLGDSRSKVESVFSGVDKIEDDNGNFQEETYYNDYQYVTFYYFDNKVYKVDFSWKNTLFKEKGLTE